LFNAGRPGALGSLLRYAIMVQLMEVGQNELAVYIWQKWLGLGLQVDNTAWGL